MSQQTKAPIVLLAAGGTAGHIYPASALAARLKVLGYEPHLVTDQRGAKYLSQIEEMPTHQLAAATIFGQGLRQLPQRLFTLGVSMVASARLVARLRPAAVVGFGGYPSFAPALIGLLCGKHVLIHEQNAVLGRANRLLAAVGAKLATSFATTQNIPAHTKQRFVGNPLRPQVLDAAQKPYPSCDTDAPFRVLVFGGSQGAQIFSQVVPQAIRLLPPELKQRLEITHQASDIDEAKRAFDKAHISAEIRAYFDDIPARMRDAHLVICRGGAGTIAELTALGVPAIIVPLPSSLDQDQLHNTIGLDRKAAWLFPQAQFIPEALADKLKELMTNPAMLQQAARAAKSFGVDDAAGNLGAYVAKIITSKPPFYHSLRDGAVHIVGIGGIGMSGLAEILLRADIAVQGSDVAANANTERLAGLGAKIFIGHSAKHIGDNVSLLTHSPAVGDTNPELVAATKAGIKITPRAEFLAQLMRYSPAITICGTHGKTSTAALVAHILTQARLDPTAICGGIMESVGSNIRAGGGDWLVVEADESDGTFTKLPTTIGVITNIEAEHLEHYGDAKNLFAAFKTYLENIPAYGSGIVCIDDENIRAMIQDTQPHSLITYGFHEEAQVRAKYLNTQAGKQYFDIVMKSGVIKNVSLPMVGKHNVQNALAAVAVALELQVKPQVIARALRGFRGVHRRFTYVGAAAVDGGGSAAIYDDYAHHPTEIEATLAAARLLCSDKTGAKGRVIAVVQPHRYSRLDRLRDEFAASFTAADNVVVLPVYAAGEKPIKGANAKTLAAAIPNAQALSENKQLAPALKQVVQRDDIIVCMGAGDISQLAHSLPKELQRESAL